MEQGRPLDRRNRRWGSLKDSTEIRVRLSIRAKELLSTLRSSEEEQIGYGALIEKLLEKHARLLRRKKKTKTKAQQDVGMSSWLVQPSQHSRRQD